VWYDGDAGPSWNYYMYDTNSAPIYAISSPITATPEPSTLALLGVGAAGLLGYGLRRWKMRRAVVEDETASEESLVTLSVPSRPLECC
jgi:hypothetical protein